MSKKTKVLLVRFSYRSQKFIMLEDSTATDYGTNVIWRESQVRGLSSGQEPTTSSSCPTLAHVLEPLDIVKIHQHLDVVEGWC